VKSRVEGLSTALRENNRNRVSMDTLPESSRFVSPRVLLVEDEPVVCSQIRNLLEQEGFEVLTKGDGIEALDLLEREPVDLIIADVTMPRMDGFELCARIRRNPALNLVPVVFLTAQTSREVRLRGRELGADDFLAKPFEVEELLQIVRTRISRTRQIADRVEEGYATRVTENLSHELRTPLTVIRGIVSILETETGLEPNTRRELLRSVHQNGLVLNRLVDNFLHLARTESDGFRVSKRPTDLSTLVDTVRAAHQDEADEKGVRIVASIPLELPPLPAQPGELVIVLANILDNAIKFTERDGTITISASPVDPWVHLVIEDTGCGIESESLPQVFDRFYREEEKAHTQPGVGLGLTVAQRIVLAHGGRIDIASKKGKGTRVTVALPAG
jgi:two-component system sensor histidine kinase/response regulator